MWGDRWGQRIGQVAEAGARPVSGASVAVFRVAFGIAMAVNTLLYLPYLVHEYYVRPSFTFPYPPFAFVQPLPGVGMQLTYIAMGVLGLTIAAGLWYRASCGAFFVLTTYVFLLDSSYFQNHEYLISLLSFLMIFLPLHRKWSMDARRRPAVASPTVPAWVVWLLRFQIGVPYFFGGIAKLNEDWLRGEPLRMWLAERTDVQVIGRFFTEEPVVWFMVYGSMVFDLVVVWLLLYHRTRPFAFAVALCFHLLNARMFGLYVFPWLMIAATTLFFPPDWPERLWARLRRFTGGAPDRPGPARSRDTTAPDTTAPDGSAPGSAPAAAVLPPAAAPAAAGPRARRAGPLLAGCLAVWVLVQVLLPLRHFVIPGTVNWTEEGHRFAWHMMLRTKHGSAEFQLSDQDRTWRVDNSAHLTPKQEHRMAGHPERIVQYAHHLSELHDGAEVRVSARVSLNGRERALFIDPTVDLSQVPATWWGAADWILPLEEPLRR
ncbi:HTTM domain-containing protein [Streptomyces sp. ACA25]|uniref:HTTM domain-containing protein n=1 Tax=Streptomyces sp. ACA25 TaxID=3022596 RepID=UPI0023075E58|nr:HTTM domain-containing protein [Streptomyces sp. ACA25]MDB1088222.1 HTTM domain-containing protein [Streptomyces sp. ACA25]